MKELLDLFEVKFTTKQKLCQIIGRLNWATSVIEGGRPFIRRFINRTIGILNNHQKLAVPHGLKADAKMWLHFLTEHSGRAFFLPCEWVNSEVINLHSDASVEAGSFIYGSQWF